MTRLAAFRRRVIPAALAVALPALGLPQTADSALRLYAGWADDMTGEEGPPAPAAARESASLLERLDGRLADPRARIRAGILRLRLALAPDAAEATRRAALAGAVGDLTDGLARAPGDAFAWAALAEALLASGYGERAAHALRTSMLLAGYAPGLSLLRSALGLRLFLLLSEEDRGLWADQVRLAWDKHPAELLALAREAGQGVAIGAALAADPARLAAFDFSALEFQGIERIDLVYGAGAGVKYLVNRNLDISLTYSFLKRQSDAIGQDYSRDLIMLKITAKL